MKIKEILYLNKKNNIAYALLLLYFIVLSCAAIFSKSTYGGGDSWLHFQMARYAPQHPGLFMDQWGKPFYTMLVCLPSQLGFIGIKFFNIGCGLITAYLAFRMAKNQFDKYQWLAVVFVLSVPIYFVTLFSGLTESVFALCIMSAVFLFHIYRVGWACLVISFLPFIRSEGFLFLPLFGLLCVYYKRWTALPFLTVGFIVFTVIGYFFSGSWNWVFGTNVYLTQPTNYGSGLWYHFFQTHTATFGWAYSIFLVIAMVSFVLRLKRNSRNRELLIQIVLLFGGLAIYFAAHSYFWYKGIFGSAGLNRVMAGVGPCIGYTAFCGFQFLVKQNFMKHIFAKIILILAVLWVFVMPRYVYAIPIKFTAYERIQMDAVKYLKQNNLVNYPLYCYDPFYAAKLKKDPFDKNIFPDMNGFGTLPFIPNAIILWDNRLYERGIMPSKDVMETKGVKLLVQFFIEDMDPKNNIELRIYLTQ